MKSLNGRDLAEFIKERQARQVSAITRARQTKPRLGIILTTDDPAGQLYTRLKKNYGEDIGVRVDILRIDQAEALRQIDKLNLDKSVHGIIVQLPMAEPDGQRAVLDTINPGKDVDGLGAQAAHTPATALAIDWLLNGYNIDLRGKSVLIIGRGKLVGEPLAKLWQSQDIEFVVAHSKTENLEQAVKDADIIVTAVGKPALISPSMLKQGVVVVDAGVAEVDGRLAGDLDPAVYKREDLVLTPVKGGVGPLTVCALFENLIKAASS